MNIVNFLTRHKTRLGGRKRHLLQTAVEIKAQVPKHDILILVSDGNAKVGTLNAGWEQVMGREEIGTSNKNRLCLAEMVKAGRNMCFKQPC